MENELPAKLIKGLGHIQFNKHARALEGVKRLNVLMGKDNVVQNLEAFDIADLFDGNEGGKEGLQLVGNDFGDDFIDDITKINRVKVKE